MELRKEINTIKRDHEEGCRVTKLGQRGKGNVSPLFRKSNEEGAQEYGVCLGN